MDFVNGIDVSHWNGVMDWHKAKAAGAQFAFIRAGSINAYTGVCYTDYQFSNNQRAAEVLPIGMYWYFRPEHDATRQANYLANLYHDTDAKLGIWADFETNDKKYIPASIAEKYARFIYAFQDRAPDCRHIAIYTRAFYWNANVGTNPLWKHMDLAIAMYNETVTHPWIGSGAGYKPRDWDEWDKDWWQWSADKNGLNATFGGQAPPDGCYGMDLDRWGGTWQEFVYKFGLEEEAPPPMPPSALEILWREAHAHGWNLDGGSERSG